MLSTARTDPPKQARERFKIARRGDGLFAADHADGDDRRAVGHGDVHEAVAEAFELTLVPALNKHAESLHRKATGKVAVGHSASMPRSAQTSSISNTIEYTGTVG